MKKHKRVTHSGTFEASKKDKNLLKRVDDFGKGFSDWEVNFTESCAKWLETHPCLTDPMRKKLEQIDDARVR